MQALERTRGHHITGGDRNPSYEITIEGLFMLHKQEHVFKPRFFDEALRASSLEGKENFGGQRPRSPATNAGP
ncbi:MAG: hypothetical protein FJ314_02095 [SAR202 cluster bacterium]|nr:hypothetical protein [SAR202 cluster bacterium]